MNKRAIPFIGSILIFGSVLLAENLQLPYQVGDGNGNQWVVYYQGQLQQQGNQPIFSQTAMITLNGQQPRQNNQQATLDDKTREVVLNFNPNGAIRHQRRLKFDEETGIVRIVDVFENTSDKETPVTVQLMTNTNYGVNGSQIIEDPKKKGQLGWAADTGAGRAALSLWAGKGSKLTPNIRYNQGNNVVNANFNFKVAGKEKAALVHWHGSFDSSDGANTWVQQMRESKLTADLSAELKKVLLNIGGIGSGSVAGKELLRGENADIIELRGGDQIRGDLKIDLYKLNTAFGTIQLPSARVASILNVGDFRARQLLVSAEGEIFGGELADKTIPIQLSSGQITQVPLAQIARIGYRTGGVEQPEWQFNQPMVFLRSGERCVIAPQERPIDFVTRYGVLSLKPEQVAIVNLKTVGNAHEVYLADGSKLSGIISNPQWPLKLTSASGDATVAFPLAAVARVQIKPLPEDIGFGRSTLSLQGGDIVATRLEGKLRLLTTFDTIEINAEEIRAIARPDEGLPDVQITMFDQSTFRGTLEAISLPVRLYGELLIDVPVAAVRDYDNPQPFPSASIVEKTRQAIAQLNADDWKQRESAEAALIALGSNVLGVLEDALPGQPPEVRQRLGGVIKRLKKDAPASITRLAPPPPIE